MAFYKVEQIHELHWDLLQKNKELLAVEREEMQLENAWREARRKCQDKRAEIEALVDEEFLILYIYIYIFLQSRCSFPLHHIPDLIPPTPIISIVVAKASCAVHMVMWRLEFFTTLVRVALSA